MGRTEGHAFPIWQDILRQEDEEVVMLACSVITNVEQYSFARQW